MYVDVCMYECVCTYAYVDVFVHISAGLRREVRESIENL